MRVNDVQIGYRFVGSGPPLVLIPGFAFTMAEWDPKLVATLAKTHRVVLFDNRGVATSTDTPGNRLTIGQMAADTAALIQKLNLGRADVLGWSMGGYIAQELALRYPARVHRLVLASTDPGSAYAIQPSRSVIHRLTHAKSSASLLPLLFPRKALPAGQAWLKRIGVQAPRLPKNSFTVSPRIAAQQEQASGPGWESAGHGSYTRLPHLRAQKTLIAYGKQDVIVPPGNALLLAKRIHNSMLVPFKGAGHAFLFQDIRGFAVLVRSFLD